MNESRDLKNDAFCNCDVMCEEEDENSVTTHQYKDLTKEILMPFLLFRRASKQADYWRQDLDLQWTASKCCPRMGR